MVRVHLAHNGLVTDGQSWIASLGPQLVRQQSALRDLLAFCESSPAVSSLSVGCSLGRSAADEYSDVDAAVGVACARGAAGASQVRAVQAALLVPFETRLVDASCEEASSGDFFIRRVFAQLDDGVQLDLAVIAEAEVRRGDAAPDFVTLHQKLPHERGEFPAATRVDSHQVADWAFRGWRALLDADKYLRRASAWEAHQRLNEARHHIWALWAAVQGATYPQHGLSQVLDHDPLALPEGIELTVAGLNLSELRSAVTACAGVLEDVSAQAAEPYCATLPRAFSSYAQTVLEQGRFPS